MGILPERRKPGDEPPPLVAYWRDVIRASRIGRWVVAHKNASAAAAALLASLKLWKWLIVDLVRCTWHPGEAAHWAAHHVLLAVSVTAAVFAVAFAVARLGLDWFDFRLAFGRRGRRPAAQRRMVRAPAQSPRHDPPAPRRLIDCALTDR